MYNDYKFTYANIDKTAFNQELSRRGSYYANVVMWTTLFSLPLFVLIDYLFCKDLWIDFLLIRLVGAGISYLIYYYSSNNSWQYLKTVAWFVGVNVVINSLITSFVPINVISPLSYFLILSIIMLIINTTIFWNPVYSIYTAVISILTILFVYFLKDEPNKYTVLIEQGGGVYIVISGFACLLAYTRFNVLMRDTEKSVMIDDANNKLIAKTEQIKDEQFKIEEANRKLKTVSENSLDNMTVLMHDFKNFSDTVKGSLDNLKSSADNLMPEQLDILNNLTVNHDKLNYMAEKLGDTASVVTTVDSPDAPIHFNKEDFDINPEVEKAVMEIAESAMLKNMSLQLNISPAANHVYQDKLFTDQVLSKLMNNVIRLSESGSIITVRSEYVNGKAVIETVSHGAIIGMDKLEEMMNRLKYASITDDNSLTNLGLLATKKLVESMGGAFVYNSEYKTGNYFKIEYPSNNHIE